MTAATDYHLLVPTYRDDFNTCFYCGCIASAHDYAPPRQYLEFYLATREPSEFLQVPSCTECYDHLKACKAGTLDERRKFAKDKLAKKYAKAEGLLIFADSFCSSLAGAYTRQSL